MNRKTIYAAIGTVLGVALLTQFLTVTPGRFALPACGTGNYPIMTLTATRQVYAVLGG